MSRLLENPKVFAATAILFTIATLFNFSAQAVPVAGSSLVPAPFMAPTQINQEIGPSIPPNPWDPPKSNIGPSSPPKPWDPPKVAMNIGPSIPPNPWDPPKVDMNIGPSIPPNPWDPPKVAMNIGPSIPPNPWDPPKAA